MIPPLGPLLDHEGATGGEWAHPDSGRCYSRGPLACAQSHFSYGDPSVLAVEEVDEPHAGPGQVRIRAGAASINPVDWKFRAGYMAEFFPVAFPAVPGNGAAGTVDQVGEGVTGVSAGDRVFGTTMLGGTAEHVVLSAWAGIPATWTTEQAAGAGFAGMVAVRSLDLIDLTIGQTLLIEGAAGGVGSMAAQIGVARGLTVIGTASEANHDHLRSIGVIPTTYGAGLADRVSALAPDGVDGALDTVGSGSLADLITITGAPGKVASLADYTALAAGALLVDGSSGDPAAALQEVATLADTGQLSVNVSQTFPMEEIGDAHTLSQAGHVRAN